MPSAAWTSRRYAATRRAGNRVARIRRASASISPESCARAASVSRGASGSAGTRAGGGGEIDVVGALLGRAGPHQVDRPFEVAHADLRAPIPGMEQTVGLHVRHGVLGAQVVMSEVGEI